MGVTVQPQVEIDQRIRENADLLSSVSQATAYLRKHLDGVEYPALIRWDVSAPDATRLALTLSDTPVGSGSTASRELLTRDLLADDPYRRNVFALDVFSDLLHQRSLRIRERIDEHVRKIDFGAYAEAYRNAPQATAPE